MYRLLNSAMMPAPGRYSLSPLDAEQFGGLVREAHRAGQLVSYVGYPPTADLIARLAGVPVAVSREQTTLREGDVLLIARLRYRVADPRTKGDPVADDFEFFHCSYHEA